MDCHDGGVHRGEVHFRHLGVEADGRHEGEAALVDGEQFARGFEVFGFGFAPGDKDAVGYCPGQLLSLIHI